jgi:hypothetical protein
MRRRLKANPTATWEARSWRWPRRTMTRRPENDLMPLNEKVYDAQIRFVIKSEMKGPLFREAKRDTWSPPTSCACTSRRDSTGGLVKTGGRATASEQSAQEGRRFTKADTALGPL